MPLSRHSVGTNSVNELARNLSGNIRQQSLQLVEPLWTDLCIKSGISVRELISTEKKKKEKKNPTKKKKRAQAENKWSNILPKLSQLKKKATTTMMASMESEDWGLSCIIVSLPGSLRV